MLDTNNNISPDTTDYAELPRELRPLTECQIDGLRLLGLDDAGIERAKANRNQKIINDARLRQSRRRWEIYRKTGRMVQQ